MSLSEDQFRTLIQSLLGNPPVTWNRREIAIEGRAQVNHTPTKLNIGKLIKPDRNR